MASGTNVSANLIEAGRLIANAARAGAKLVVLPENFAIVCGAITIEWFGYGFGFVGIILFMMQQIAPGKYKMAHYAFATAVMNLGFMLPSMVSGYISDFLGYKSFFLWVMVATIPSFLVAWFVPFKEVEKDEAAV